MGDYAQSPAPKILDSAGIVEIDTGLGRVAVDCEQSGTTTDAGSNDLTTGILKFRGIKYAEIVYRWAAPRATGPWSGLKSCTQFGPGCPQISRPLFDINGIPLFGRLGREAIPIQPDRVDEFDCLNLNIWAPVTIKGDRDGFVMKKKLPVLVWVHGGAYTVGSGGVNLYGMCAEIAGLV
jgi:carboxylesterase type B